MLVFLKVIFRMFLFVSRLGIKACTVTYSLVISNETF